jgi:hypothetical protein
MGRHVIPVSTADPGTVMTRPVLLVVLMKTVSLETVTMENVMIRQASTKNVREETAVVPEQYAN